MCLSPAHVWVSRPTGHEKVQVPCSECWQCIKGRINDYVGRSLAETAVSNATAFLTLTYGKTSCGSDTIVNKKHFQLFMKKLRILGHRGKNKFKVRYLVVGEYGERNGRAHFHALLFFKGTAPSWPERENFHDLDIWPHGHLWCEWSNSEAAVRYVVNYIREQKTGHSWFSQSRQPMLGWDWFVARAEANILAGVWPRSCEYVPPGAETTAKFLMGPKLRKHLVMRYCQELEPVLETMSPTMAEIVSNEIDREYRSVVETASIMGGLAKLMRSLRDKPQTVKAGLWNMHATGAISGDAITHVVFHGWSVERAKREFPS